MKNLITLTIVTIIFFAAGNTVSAKTPNWTTITTTKVDSVHSKTFYQAVQKIDGKFVTIKLVVYTNSQTANILFAETENEDCTGYAPVQTTIAKNFAKVDLKKTDEGFVVSYEDRVTEKNVPTEIAYAQK